MPEGSLAGLAGLVTGAASGIGAAVARELSGKGAAVALADVDEAGLARVLSELHRAGGRALARRADVTRPDELAAAVAECRDRLGDLDFVVANAGRGLSQPFAEGEPERWRAVLDTNVLGTALTLRAALPRMRERGRGHLVVVASVSGLASYAGETIYVASKWAVVGLMRALRLELTGSGLRLTVVAPGLVETPLSRGNPFAAEWMQRLQPLQDVDVAHAISFALGQPQHVDVNEIVLRPRGQEV